MTCPMSWSTDGSGDFEYNYGDVEAAAQSSQLGTLLMVPRLLCLNSGGEVFEPAEFLGPLQARILERGLPWTALPFDIEVDESGESIVAADRDPRRVLREIRAVVLAHRSSVLAIIQADAPHFEVEKILLGTDLMWELSGEDEEALAAWLNAPLEGAPISAAALMEGEIDDGEYDPPAELEDALAQLEDDASSRHLVAIGWAHALLAEEELWLGQPDDEFQRAIWTTDTGDLNETWEDEA